MTYRKSTALLLLALSACGDDFVSAGDTETDGTSSTGSPETTTGAPPSTTDESADAGTSTGIADGSSSTWSTEATGDTTGELPVCGDGFLFGDEACDDGNTDPGDGCSDTCDVEAGFTCDDAEPTVCAADCGDGVIVGMEECDDGSTDPGDGCSDTCTVEEGWACDMEPSVCEAGCGDGFAVGMEECDDGAFDPGDGCSARCTVEAGWLCDDASPSDCTEDCGDGMLVGAEECDGGPEPTAGCSDTCNVESGYTCEGEPSVCATACGDGLVAGLEECDDGDIGQGDGCNAVCSIEFPFSCEGEPSACTIAETLAAITLGSEGGCVLTASGTVACFGSNSESQTGDGTDEVDAHLPVAVLENVTAVSSGSEHVCAVDDAGGVLCWGDNDNSQMGPMSVTPNDVTTPLEMAGLPTIVAVEGGYDHNCAIDDAGLVWCWGDNDNRQLGRGGTGTADDPTPAAVTLPLPAVDLGLGENHTCAVLDDDTVACWGDDDSGQLGDGSLGTDSGTPTIVPGLANIQDVEAGRDTTCALDSGGTVYCWGNNNDGELGDGTLTDNATPQAVPLIATADAIALGENFSCALLSNDRVYCWGEGSDYQLGYGDTIDQSSPRQVTDMPAGDIVDIEAGARGVCAVFATNTRHCWGYSENGQLGIAPRNQLELSAPLSFSGPLVALELARPEYRGNTCGVLADGTVECAGEGSNVSSSTVAGTFGIFNGIAHHLSVPTTNPGLTDVQALAIGDSSICYATSTNVQCFGDNLNRQLGQGGASTTDITSPVAVLGLGAVDELEAGDSFYCVRTGGTVQCWGDNDNAQCGVDGTTTDQSTPVTVPSIADAQDIALGDDHACALRAGGVVSCWGDDDAGQLGDDDANTNDSGVPVDVTGLPGAATQIVAGQNHTCVLVDTEVYCWGDATYGQLGQGDQTDSDTAVVVPGLPAIVQISSGFNYVCAIDEAADMWCWGYGLDGHLGNGGEDVTGLESFPSPISFEAASGITDVVCGNSHTCVETALGWQCVGFRSAGQLGDGTTHRPAQPTGMFFGI